MRRIIKITIGVIILGVFVWTIVFLYQKSQPKPVVFTTKTALVLNIVKKTVATGSIVPRKEVEIKSQVSGIIEEMYVEAGNKIKKGDLIAKVKIIANMVELNNAESRLNKAKITFDDAKKVYERQKQLFDTKVIPEADYLPSKTAFLSSQEEVESAENNLQLIREGVLKSSGKTTNTLIRSTIDGMVLDVPVQIGNSVIETNAFNPGTIIAVVADIGEMIFKGKVDETEVGKIKPGMELLLSIGAIETEKFKAVLEYIAPKGVLENGAIQFEIRAKVELRDNVFIRSGYSANADIVLARRDSVLAIEESLMTIKGDSTTVEVETKPNVFEKRLIKTGLSDGINVEILSGITKTDKLKAKEASDMDKKPEEKK